MTSSKTEVLDEVLTDQMKQFSISPLLVSSRLLLIPVLTSLVSSKSLTVQLDLNLMLASIVLAFKIARIACAQP